MNLKALLVTLSLLFVFSCGHHKEQPRLLASQTNKQCELPKGEELTIGVTMGYNNYQRALQYAAHELGYNIKIKVLNHYISGEKLGDYQLVLAKIGDEKLKQKIREQLAQVDGILSTGGHDIHPGVWETTLPVEERATAWRLHDAYGNLSKQEKASINKFHEQKLSEAERMSFLERFITKRGEYNNAKKALKNLQRDVFETTLMDLYFTEDSNKDKPFIGICYGMQMLATHKGIPLTVDIKAQLGIRNRYPLQKKSKKSPVSEDPFQGYIVNAEEFETLDLIKPHRRVTPFTQEVYEFIQIPEKVPEYHHQNLGNGHFMTWMKKNKDVLKENKLEVLSTSNDGAIAEVIVAQDRPAFGVQFHPERSTDRHFKKELFGTFLRQACRRKIQSN